MKLRHQILCVLLAAVMLIGMLPMPHANAATNANTDLQTAAATGVITLVLTDSYGDGWNDNQIAVYIDGQLFASYTISSGASATYSISYDMSKCYEFKWVKGSFPGECSFKIVLDSEVLLNATKTQCSSYTSGQSLMIIDAVDYDFEGEFAGGTGTAADPYLVATKQQLDNVRNHPTSYFKQVLDITFTPSDFAATGAFYNNGQGWEPIGNTKAPFYGAYDGNACAINGLTITRNVTEDYAYIGLFGANYGDIANVTLKDLSYTITGQSNICVGGVAGQVSNKEIIGCHASGKIEAVSSTIGGVVGSGSTVKYCTSDVSIIVSGEGWPTIGGVAGISATMIGCVNNGDISSDCSDTTVGGVTGNNWNGVSNCKNNGNITVNTEASTAYLRVGGIAGSPSGYVTKCENSGAVIGAGYQTYVGGIVGLYYGHDSTAVIAECVNKGTVSTSAPSGANTATYSYAGGIVGSAEEGAIRDCYVTNDVTLTAKGTQDAMAGGIAGEVWHNVTITNCYTLVNSVSVNTYASEWGRGGIAGHNYGTISNCYYRYTYGVGYNAGSSSVTRVSALGDYATQSIYSGFDFTSIWQMGTDYALLQMENGHTHSLTHSESTVTFEASGTLEHWYCTDCDTYFRNAEATLYVTEAMLASDPLPRTGTCGEHAEWSLSHDGVLTISGTGDVADYTVENLAPWDSYRDNVKTLIVEPGITGIGDNAFKGCASLCDVSLPAGITEIGSGAFLACSSIEKLDIPEGVTTIGACAFDSCSGLQYLLLPESVTSIGDGLFTGVCDLLLCFQGDAPMFEWVNVFFGSEVSAYYPAGNPTWTEDVMQPYAGKVDWIAYDSLEDVIIDSGSAYPVRWTVSIAGTLMITGEYGDGEIPDYTYSKQPDWEVYKDRVVALKCVNVARIGDYAFDYYPALKHVDFGDVEEIGFEAFRGCTALESVYLQGGSNQSIIENYAFYGCSSLRRLTINDQVAIGSKAFALCSQLTEIYVGTHYHGDSGTTYNLLNGYYGVSIQADSFQHVVATVYLPVDWLVQDYGDYGGTLTWQQAKFGPCGTDAYWTYDEETATITITGTGSIASYSVGSRYPWFGLCKEVKHVVFEDGITTIASYVFEFMTQIQTVRLPNTLQYLACNAFNDCSSLNNLLIPATVKEFELYGYFNRCNSLTDVYYLGTAEEWENVKNHSVIGNGSYDHVKTIHFLVLTERTATCTQSGTEAYYSFPDSSVYTTKYNIDKQPIDQPAFIPATGHSYGDWFVEVEASCSTEGNERRDCNNCDHFETKSIEALGHGEIVYVIHDDGTHTASYECCGEVIETVAHCYDAWSYSCDCGDVQKFTVTWIVDGASYTSSVAYGTVIQLPDTPTKENHVFVCWEGYTEGMTMPAYDLTFTAHWEVEVVYGDVDGDGEVNGKDLVVLRRYLGFYDFDTGVSAVEVSVGADVNDDGVINGKDLVLLRRYLANYNFETGESTIILGPSA